MISRLQKSLTLKISSLSAILLGFIFIVIVYSILKLLIINREMREIAEVDVPLTQIISEVEVLQLQQHILLEQIRLNTDEGNGSVRSDLSERYQQQDQKIRGFLKRADQLINNAIRQGQVVDALAEHKQVVSLLRQFNQDREAFSLSMLSYLGAVQEEGESDWTGLESHYKRLDQDIYALLQQIENLTEDISLATERHTREFMLVNLGLGISALIIGIQITAYIILSFRRRVRMLQGQLSDIHDSLDNKEALAKRGGPTSEHDELSELAAGIDSVVERFVGELNSRYEIEDKLIELAVTDKLTGALNRHKWEESVNTEIELAERGAVFSLIALDLDHFKKINDTYGHDVGDQVLIKTVEIIKQRIRSTDSLFRLGGEEFFILARQTDQNAATNLAQTLCDAMAAYQDNSLPQFTTSIGIAEFTPGETLESIVKRADQALYNAKHNGRNQVSAG